MKIYHRTDAAEEILRDGFNGRPELKHLKGVWFADAPIMQGVSVPGDFVLSVDVPDDSLAEYEDFDRLFGPGIRYFMLPADVANLYGPPKIHAYEWSGHTEAEIIKWCDFVDKSDAEYMKPKAARMREMLPFLRDHGLLKKDDWPPSA